MRIQTHNDLCANSVTLDYQTMLYVAKSAFSYALEAVYNDYKQLSTFPYSVSTSMRKIVTEALVDNASRLNITANMLSTLEDGLECEEVEVVNHTQKEENDVS